MAVDILLPQHQRKLKCYLSKDGRSRALQIGDGLRIRSYIQENSDWHRGTFHYRRYLEVRGFTGSTFVRSRNWQKTQVSLKSLSRIERTKLFFLQLRSRLLCRLSRQGLEDESYAVVAAMALGDKSALSKELKDVYSQTGASHVLALSGLHLGIIYTLLSLLTVGRRRRMVSQALLVLSIWAFVFLVGLPSSVVRAAVMLSVYALLSLGHRDKMSVNTLAFTAMMMLMVNPMALYDVGFQLSFMAVFSILVCLPLFERVFSRQYLLTHRPVRWAWSLVSVSCAAQIGVAPLIAYYFGRFSTYFLLTNFIVVPAATLILYLSLIVFILPSLTFLLIYAVSILNKTLTLIASIPRACIDGLHPSVIQVSMVYLIIGAVVLMAFRIMKGSPEHWEVKGYSVEHQ
jgi:competence protein ComEC